MTRSGESSDICRPGPLGLHSLLIKSGQRKLSMAIDAETGIFDRSADPPPAGSLQSAAGGLPERLVVLPFAVSFLALFHEALRGRERRSRGVWNDDLRPARAGDWSREA